MHCQEKTLFLQRSHLGDAEDSISVDSTAVFLYTEIFYSPMYVYEFRSYDSFSCKVQFFIKTVDKLFFFFLPSLQSYALYR